MKLKQDFKKKLGRNAANCLLIFMWIYKIHSTCKDWTQHCHLMNHKIRTKVSIDFVPMKLSYHFLISEFVSRYEQMHLILSISDLNRL